MVQRPSQGASGLRLALALTARYHSNQFASRLHALPQGDLRQTGGHNLRKWLGCINDHVRKCGQVVAQFSFNAMTTRAGKVVAVGACPNATSPTRFVSTEKY